MTQWVTEWVTPITSRTSCDVKKESEWWIFILILILSEKTCRITQFWCSFSSCPECSVVCEGWQSACQVNIITACWRILLTIACCEQCSLLSHSNWSALQLPLRFLDATACVSIDPPLLIQSVTFWDFQTVGFHPNLFQALASLRACFAENNYNHSNFLFGRFQPKSLITWAADSLATFKLIPALSHRNQFWISQHTRCNISLWKTLR